MQGLGCFLQLIKFMPAWHVTATDARWSKRRETPAQELNHLPSRERVVAHRIQLEKWEDYHRSRREHAFVHRGREVLRSAVPNDGRHRDET